MKISEVCEKFGLSQDTVRYYERIGLLPKVAKNAGGFRRYTDRDCRRIAMIKFMRTAGTPIEQLAQYIDMARSGGGTAEARKNILRERRDRLSEKIGELQATLRGLDEKIAGYESHGASEEENLFS